MEVFEKSQTVDPEVRAYVYSLVNAVGGSSTLDDTYQVGDDALAALNDLQRWLRLYDEKLDRYDVKRCLAEANLVKGDLLEILADWPEEQTENRVKAKLALACLQLLVPLTWPLEFKEDRTTKNHVRHAPYLQLAQVGYKRAVLGYELAGILRTVVRTGLPSISVEKRERSRRDESIIKLVVYFFRNIALITQPQHLPSQGDENDISRSSTIDAFSDQDVFTLLLTIGSGTDNEFQEEDVILLEVLFHLLKGIDPAKLFMSTSQVSDVQTDELQMLMIKEKAMHKGYNKHAPTRHNRFGTMIWVKRDDSKMSTVTGQHTIANERTTLHQMDASKKWNKPKYRGKMVQEFDELSDVGSRVELTETARKHLRSFVEDFLDSSFNPLFASLRKAIEREADRVLPSHHRQYFYLISWFLSASQARRSTAISQLNAEAQQDNSFAYIAAVLDQETFVLLNRYMQRSFDEKSWQDLQSTLLCFTQILLTVQDIAESKDEEDQEIAENIQNRIFYEESTHDRLVQILRGYSNQGFAYLDAVTDCTHVFVRLLEKYSKQNVDLQIRSKRRARRKKRSTQQVSTNDNENAPEQEDNDEDEREAHLTARERSFDFARFSSKIFANQSCVDTFLSLLHFYADLSPAQLKRCHRFLYRLAFKHENALLLFRADVLLLLHRMVKGPKRLDPEDVGKQVFGEWETLVQQIFRRCIKWIEKDCECEGWKGMCVVEMLFSKVPATMFYLQNGYERVIERRAPRPPAELEFKASVIGKKVAVAVSLLIEKGEAGAVGWVKKELERAVRERQAWTDLREATAMGGVEAGSAESPSILLTPDCDERKTQLFANKHLRLLLTTLGLQRLGMAEDVDASWTIPSDLSTERLQQAYEEVKKAEFDPPNFDDGKTAEDMIRSKSSARRNAAFSASESDGDSGGEIDDAMFPPNERENRSNEPPPKKRRRLTKRNKTDLTEAEAEERAAARRHKEREKNSKIKSQLFVTASDDESDEERDAEFFRLEEVRRKKMAGIIRSALLNDDNGSESESGKKRKAESEVALGTGKKRRVVEVESGGEEEDAMSDGSADSTSDIAASKHFGDSLDDDEGGEEEDTPSTSPIGAGGGEPDDAASPLKEVSGNAAAVREGVSKVVESDDEDDQPVVKTLGKRSFRAGFIIDDDSE